VGLRAVRRLGRLADHVLSELETKGHYDQRAPWLAPAMYGRHYHVKYSRFPAIPCLTREVVPGYGPLQIVHSYKTFLKKANGVESECFNVLVRAAVPDGSGGFKVSDVKIGYVRLNSGSFSFYAAHHDGEERSRSFRLLKSARRGSVLAMAKAVAEASAGPGFRTEPFAAIYYGCLCEWLVKDGHAEALMEELRDMASSHQTVKTVLTL